MAVDLDATGAVGVERKVVSHLRGGRAQAALRQQPAQAREVAARAAVLHLQVGQDWRQLSHVAAIQIGDADRGAEGLAQPQDAGDP